MIPAQLRWFYHQTKPVWGLYLVRVSTVLFTSVLVLIDPLILKWLIDEVLPWRKGEMLWLAAVAFLVLFFFRFGFTSLSLLIDTYAGERLMIEIRCKLLKHLQRLSASYHLRTPQGDLLHRLEQDTEEICRLGGRTLASLLRVGVMSVLSVVIMAVLDWRLTLFVVPLVPLMLVLRRYTQPRLRRASKEVQEATARRVTFLRDQLAGMDQVQLFGREAGERRRFVGLCRDVLGKSVRRRGEELGLSFATRLAVVLATALVLGYGGHRVLAGALSIGGLVAFYTYLNRLFDPMSTVVRMYSRVQRAMVSIDRVRKVLEERPEVVEPETPHRFPPREELHEAGAEAKLDDVVFEYDAGDRVLDGLHLRLEPGEKVALVGSSGSGKSTVARLLTRQYDVCSGEVRVDGRRVDEVSLRRLRSRVALVPQEPALFDLSLQDNLRFAAPKAKPETLKRALKTVQLSSLLDDLPEGLDERLGPRGERLSGGQRQRVAVARALLRNPRLLILDEATSGLDGFTERRLLQGLEHDLESVTVLLIAHRLSAVRWTDRVVMLEDGAKLAEGPHLRLYESCAAYRKLCDQQATQDEDPVVFRRSDETERLEGVAV